MCLRKELLSLKIGFDYSVEWLRKNRKTEMLWYNMVVLMLLHIRGDLYFFIFAFGHDLHSSLHTNTENTPNVSFKIPYSGWNCWMKNSCLHPKWDWFFQVKKKKSSLEIVFKWKMYTIASIPSAWCPSRKEDYSCLLWHFIKYCVLIQVTWGILQNLLFCFPLHLLEV